MPVDPHPQETPVKRILSAVAAAALGLGLLAACGDDDGGGNAGGSGDYCKDLKTAKKNIDSIQDGDLTSFSKTVDAIHDLRDEAPDEIEEDWKILSDAFDKIVDAFEKAGLDDEDIAAIQSGQIPDGVDQAALTEAYAEIGKLADDKRLTQATEAIQKHAKDECGIDLEN